MAIGTLAAVGLAAAGVGTALGASSNKKAATTAANAQTQATTSNNALARDIYGQNKATLAPYVAAGVPATSALNAFLGLGTPQQQGAANSAFGSFINNSDYGFQFGEGANALNSGYAGSGMIRSGAAMRDLEQYRQNLQQGYRTEWTNALGNQQSLGLGAASAQAGVGQNYVNTISSNNQNAADALSNAALIKGQNNPLANALGLVGGGLFGMR